MRPKYVPLNDNGNKGEKPEKSNASRKQCIIHQVPMEGLNYICPECNSIYCLSCIKNLLLSTEQCIVCEEPVLKDEYFEIIKQELESGGNPNDAIPKINVTTIAPEVWKKIDQFQISEEIIDELLENLKYIPPDKRVRYLEIYFSPEEEFDDFL
ncbi:MAG: hypothetical protein ACFFCS_23590 [Candidatus Hodarchaeota archaeon]